MKKVISLLLALSMIESLCISAVKAENSTAYFDTVPKEIPANLIKTTDIVGDANNAGNAGFNNDTNGAVKYYYNNYTATGWNCFAPNFLPTGNLNIDTYKAGKTYVYRSRVKNASENSSVVPLYGIAYLKSAYGNPVGSNEYGTKGMQVTSTDWMDFKATITFPEDWGESTGHVHRIYHGLSKQTPAGSAVMVEKSLDSLYLAEEIPYDIKIDGEKHSINHKETIELTAEVVNQIGIKGKLLQSFEWYAVNADRTEVEESITITAEASGAVVSVSEETPYGIYYVIAESKDYPGFRKGFEIEVKKVPVKDYEPKEDDLTNYIQNPGNSGFAMTSSDSVSYKTNTSEDGYVTIEALENIESELGAEGLRVRYVGRNGLKSDFNFEPGKSYAIKAKVRNPEPEKNVYFNVSISNSTADTLSLTTEYGSGGLLLTGEWQEFKGSIKVSENYDVDAEPKYRNLTLGLNSGSVKGAKADIELSVFVGDMVAYDLVLDGEENVVLGADDSFETEASVVNVIGVQSGLEQNFEWYILDSERIDKIDALKIEVSQDSKSAKVLTDIYSEPGIYYLVAESKDYDGFLKSVKFNVEKPSAKECVEQILKTAEKDVLANNLREYLGVLKIETDIQSINYETLAEIIVSGRDEMKDTEEFLKKAIVIAAYENPDGLYDSEGNFKYEEELNLKELDKAGVTVYSLFSKEIQSEGKKVLQKALKGEYKSFDEFEKAFAEQVILKAIEYPAKSGLGTLELILTKENAVLAGINIDEYLNLTSKTDAAKYILNKTFTKESLEKAIADIEKTIKENNKAPSIGSSSSGGGASVLIAPSVTITKEEEEITVSDNIVFADVPEEHWAYSDINYLSKINVISGMGEGTFKPDESVTREQFIKMICEAFEYEIVNDVSEFSDVEAGAWYEKYIVTAVKKGLITGIGNSKFGVGNVITRDDMAVIINRAMGGNTVGDMEGDFTDMEDIAPYAKESVVYLSSIGVINGFDNGAFMPKNECTRAQAAKIICTVLNLRGEE